MFSIFILNYFSPHALHCVVDFSLLKEKKRYMIY